jgi:hypothetical protein
MALPQPYLLPVGEKGLISFDVVSCSRLLRHLRDADLVTDPLDAQHRLISAGREGHRDFLNLARLQDRLQADDRVLLGIGIALAWPPSSVTTACPSCAARGESLEDPAIARPEASKAAAATAGIVK